MIKPVIEDLIKILVGASDRYGNPYVVGFLDYYKLDGFIEASVEQLQEYIQMKGLK